MKEFKNRALNFYQQNETKLGVVFFLGGFVFDILTLNEIDDPLSIAQQLTYLILAGSILYFEFLVPTGVIQLSARVQKAWAYRELALHFFLGNLLSVYSLFFLKSSSFFTSVIFVLLLIALMIANEMKRVQKSEVNIKIGLYVMCVFSFFSMMFPVLLGFVGLLPFSLAIAATAVSLYCVYRKLLNQSQGRRHLWRSLLGPGGAVLAFLILFYVLGWIPPVPLSVQNMGVYHKIEKFDGHYTLSHENPWWRFWLSGDQEFFAQPGDKIYFFARIFSPGRFNDSVILHWYFKDPKLGWTSTDRVSMQVTGGRRGGYRGFAVKQNYAPGNWRVSVETTDQREIGRLYFKVIPVAETDGRDFEHEIF